MLMVGEGKGCTIQQKAPVVMRPSQTPVVCCNDTAVGIKPWLRIGYVCVSLEPLVSTCYLICARLGVKVDERVTNSAVW